MRRKDREVTDIKQMIEIINQCQVVHIALKDDIGLYAVPMNFGYTYTDHQLTLYLHSAKEGRKYQAFQQFPEVAFEMDCGHALIEGKTACAYSYYYQSVMGNGLIKEVTSISEKQQALSCLMKHQTNKQFEFDEKMAEGVAVFKVVVSDFSCKKH